MNLKPGDMLYFPPHRATGILVSKFNDGIEDIWKYILRSPRPGDLGGPNLVNEFESPAQKIIKAVEEGSLVYYACG